MINKTTRRNLLKTSVVAPLAGLYMIGEAKSLEKQPKNQEFSSTETIKQIIKASIDLTRNRIEDPNFVSFKKSLGLPYGFFGYEGYLSQFCTFKFGTSRASGHTTAIGELATKNRSILVVYGYNVQKGWFLKKFPNVMCVTREEWHSNKNIINNFDFSIVLVDGYCGLEERHFIELFRNQYHRDFIIGFIG